MKTTVTLIAFILITKHICAQNYSWAGTSNTYAKSIGVSVTKDINGNLFVAETYTNPGMRNGVDIIKYDNNYNILWRKKIECNYLEYYDLATDLAGNLCYTGGYADSIFVNGAFVNRSYNQLTNMCLIKFNSAGNMIFFKYSAGEAVRGKKVTTDNQNNIYVAGIFQGNAIFDGNTVYSPYVTYNFIAKYNVNGSCAWVKYAAGTSFSGWGLGLATDNFNNTYLAGTFKNSGYFGTNTITAYPGSSDNIYIAKIDPSGNWLWAKSAGGNNQEGLFDLDLDSQGNPYITGFTSSPNAYFGTKTITVTNPDDYFLARYDASGNCTWVINGGGSGIQQGYDVCVDDQGTVYLYSNSVYLLMFNSANGAFLSSESKNAGIYDMVHDKNGCIYITGNITGTTTFGGTTIVPTGNPQMYIAKFCSPNPLDVEDKKGETSIFNVYPNPTNRNITIEYNLPKNSRVKLSIRSVTGQLIFSETQPALSGRYIKTFDLTNYASGIYLVEILCGEECKSKKIIVE